MTVWSPFSSTSGTTTSSDQRTANFSSSQQATLATSTSQQTKMRLDLPASATATTDSSSTPSGEAAQEVQSTTQVAALLETASALPATSEEIRKAYEKLKADQEALRKAEVKFATLKRKNDDAEETIDKLVSRRDYLKNSVQTLNQSIVGQKSTDHFLGVTEKRVRLDVAKLEDEIETRENRIKTLKQQLYARQREVAKAQRGAEKRERADRRHRERVRWIADATQQLRAALAADEKTVQEMESYFFKTLTQLFSLQREVDRLEYAPFEHRRDSTESESGPEGPTGWHRLSHTLDQVTPEQLRFFRASDEQGLAYDGPMLSYHELEWTQNEVNRQEKLTEKLAKERVVIDRETIQRNSEIIETIQKCERLAADYAEVESKNMAVWLRQSRIAVLATTKKLENDMPMYHKYIDVTNDPEPTPMAILYERKKKAAEEAAVLAEKAVEELANAKCEFQSIGPPPAPDFESTQRQVESLPSTTAITLIKQAVITGSLETCVQQAEDKDRSEVGALAATRRSDKLEQLASKRRRLFEGHMQECFRNLEREEKTVVNSATSLENAIWGVEEQILEVGKKLAKEKATVGMLEARQKRLVAEDVEAEDAKKQAAAQKRKEFDQEMAELQQKLVDAKKEFVSHQKRRIQLEGDIKQAKIEHNNLLHRLRVLESSHLEAQREQQALDDQRKKYDAEQETNERLRAEIERLSAILDEARIAEEGFLANMTHVIRSQEQLVADKGAGPKEIRYDKANRAIAEADALIDRLQRQGFR